MRPLLEKLEDRILLTAEPTVTVDGPDTVELGAQDVSLTLTFDNTSGDATPGDPADGDVGFVPFINVVLPTTGADGAGAEIDDGVTFDSATFLGTTVPTTEVVFDASGEAEHPLAVETNGDPLVITGTPGDTLLVIELPYGSFTPEQVPVEVELTLDFSDLADVGTPLSFDIQGGFALGDDPLDNPDADPSILGAAVQKDVTPTLLTLTKTNTGSESETATGPNFPRTWQITLDVADGQTLTNVVVDDVLPINVSYLGNVQITGGVGGMVIDQPAIGTVTPGDQDLQVTFSSVTGGTPVVIEFDYFIPETDGLGNAVINPQTGDDQTAINDVIAAGDFTPTDPRDPAERLVSDDVAADDILDLRSIAVQKSVAITDDQNVAGLTPGDELTYTLEVQVSDFFTMGDIVLTDVLSDGLAFAGGSVTFGVTEADGDTIANGTGFAASAVTVDADTPGLGETTLAFDLSAALTAAGAADGILAGDLIDGAQEGATTATVVYRATVLDQFSNPNDDAEVSQGDNLGNAVTVAATLRENANPTVGTGFSEEDTSATSVSVPFGEITDKSIVAINGAAPVPGEIISAGDTVTFSVSYRAPIGSFEDLSIDDFLPVPVFDATEVTTFGPGTGTATPPAAGTAVFGAGTTGNFFTGGGAAPSIATNAGSNALSFEFADVSIDPRAAVEIELLFTVTVVDAVFADGLLLTNQASATEENTGDDPVVTTEITQFNFGQPELSITKGVIASTAGDFEGSVGPVGFEPPGTSGQRAMGAINSTNLGASPVDADLEDVDAGDTVSFAIVVENTGSSPDGAFDVLIQDTLPVGFEIGMSGLNLDVRNGAGAAVAFTGADTDLFGAGIELTDGATGAIADFDATAGDNIVIITYDLEVADTTGPREDITNTAAIASFAAFDGGINRVPAAGLDDDAVVETLDPTIEKTLVSTTVNGDASNSVLVGETLTYEITLTLTEGTTENVVIIDRSVFANVGVDPNGGTLELLSAEVSAIGGNLTLENAFAIGDGPSTLPFDSNSDSFNDRLQFNFGDIFNDPDNFETIDDEIAITVTALVNATEATEGGDLLRNRGIVRFEGATRADNANVRVEESNVTLEKTADPTTADGDDEITFRVEVTNDPLIVDGANRSASAFDLVLTDLVDDPDLIFVEGSVSLSGDASGDAVIVSGDDLGESTIEITLDELTTGDSLIVEYRATVASDVQLGEVLVNTADLTYDSLPTDDDPNERDYDLSDEAEIAVDAPQLSKTVFSTSLTETTGTDVAIGETVVFELVATIPEGTGEIVISDTLPTVPGVLSFVSAEVTDIGEDLLASSALAVGATAAPVGGVISFDFGLIENAPDADTLEETITIQVTALVEDLPQNESGDTLVNAAVLSFGPDADDTVTAEASIDIVEPTITIDKTAPAGPVDAGDVVDYQIDVENAGPGPAFDLVISDLLADAGLALVPGTVAASDAGATITPVGDGFTVESDFLGIGDTLTITYQAEVQDAALFNSAVPNTATVEQFDTNPSDDPTDDGRTTEFDPDDPDPDLFDTEEVPTVDLTLTKDATAADTSQGETGTGQLDTGIVDLSVGEEVTYTLTISVPEGTGLVTLTDDLPLGLQALSAEVISLTGITSANLAAGDDEGAAAITIAADGSSVVFDFGEVTVAGVDDPTGPDDLQDIVVEVTAEVADVFAATAGAQLTNTATVQVFDPDNPTTELTDPDNPTQATETVEVVEPVVVIDKSAPVAVDPGETITYSVTVTHDPSSTGPAFDLVVADTLIDPDLAFNSGSVTVAGVTGAMVSEVGTGFEVTIPTLDIGETATITYTATLAPDAEPAESFPNTATLTFDSNAGDGGRVQTDEDDAIVATVPVLEKTLIDTSFAETTGNTLGLGEVATYELEIVLAEILNEDTTITDTLPAGLTPLSATVTSVGGQLSAAGTVTDLTMPNVTILGQTLTIGFDDVANAADQSIDGGDTILVEVEAVLDADLAENLDGEVLKNTAVLTIVAGGDTLSDDGSADVSVVIPELTLTKTADQTEGVDAGDVIDFTIEIENSGSGPAYDLAVEDLLADAGLSLVSGSVASSDGSTASEVANSDTTLGFTLDVPVLDAGEPLTITYQAAVTDAAEFLGQVENTAIVASFDTNPGEPGDPGFVEEQEFTADPGDPTDPLVDGETVTTIGPTVSKATSAADTGQAETGTAEFDPDVVDLSVGEAVTYTLTISVPEGSGIVTLTDSLPTGLTAIAAEVGSLAPGITTANLAAGDDETNAAITISGTGESVVFDFGEVTSTGVDDPTGAGDLRDITVSVTAVVADIAAVEAGVQLSNTATLQVFDPDDPGTELTDPIDPIVAEETVEVVEPILEIEKTSPVAAGPGEQVDYQVVITHDTLSTGPAFDLLLTDTLADPNLDFDNGSVTVGGVAGAMVTEVGTGFEVTIPVLDLGETVTVTYTATLSASAPEATSFPNTATLDFDSNGGPGGREQMVEDGASVASVPAIGKSIVSSTFAETAGNELAHGEVATFQIEFFLAEVISQDVVLTDTLPDGLTPLAARVVSAGENLTGIGTVTDLTAPVIDIMGQTVSFDFDDIDNDTDNIVDGDDAIIVEIDAVLDPDLTQNPDGTVLTNTASLTVTEGSATFTVEDAQEVEVVLADLELTKTADPVEGVDAGDLIDFTVTIDNSGAGPAYDLVIEDLMADAGLSLVSGSVTATDGSTAAEAANADGTLGFTLDAPVLLSGDRLTITYQAVVTDAAEFNGQVENTARVVSFDTNPGEAGDPGFEGEVEFTSDPDDLTDPLVDGAVVATVGVELIKVTDVTATSQAETGAGQFDPDIVDLSVGEEVVYTLTISVPEGSGVVTLTDALPAGLQALSAEVTAFETGITASNLAVGATESSAFIAITPAGDSVVFDFGTVTSTGIADPAGPDDLREIEVQVTAVVGDVAAAAAGAQLTNTATVRVFDPDEPGTELTDPSDPTNATETVEVVEPVLVVDKSAPIATQPGGTVSYQVTVAHDAPSTGPAFDVTVSDALSDPFLTLNPGSVSVVGVTGAVVTETGDGFSLTFPTLQLGATATITYTATLSPDAPAAESFVNTAEVTFDSNAGDGGREQTQSDDATVATVPGLVKELASSGFAETADPQLGLGEVATYSLQLSFSEVLNEDVVLVDTLPEGLTPLAARVTAVGTQLNAVGAVADLTMPVTRIAGETVTLDFGDVLNIPTGSFDADDSIFVEIDAVVDPNFTVNLPGEMLTNTAVLTSTEGGIEFTVEDSETVEVVVPDLALDKTASPAGDVDAGDVIDFTIEIANTGDGPAFDLEIVDLMQDAGLSLVSGSVMPSDGSAAMELANADGTLGFTVAVPFVDANSVLTITYQAVVTDAAEFNGQVENTARVVSFDTNPGEPGDPGFEGEAEVTSDPGDPDDPLIDTVSLATVDVALSKATSEADTSQAETGSAQGDPGNIDLSIGETVIYTLTVSVPEGNGIVTLEDTLPTGLQALTVQVVSIGAGIAAANVAEGDTQATDAITLAPPGDSVLVDFGEITSTGVDDPAGTGDLRDITVQVTAVVQDLLTNISGQSLTNTATVRVFDPDDPGTELTDPSTPTQATETIDIVEPELALDKSVGVTGTVDAGDILPYTLTIVNSGTGPAFDVIIEDALADPALSLVPGTVVSSDGSAALEVTNVDGTIGFVITAPLLDAGETLTITYDAEVTAAFVIGTTVENNAQVSSFESNRLNPDDPMGVDRQITPDFTDPDDPLIDGITLVSGAPQFEKAVFTTSVQGTGTAAFDPVVADLALGEIVVYRFQTLLPEGTAPLTLTDQFPTDGAFELVDVVVTDTANISGAQLLTPVTEFTDTNADGRPDLLTIDLGTVTNAPDNIATTDDVLTVDVLVRLQDNPVNASGDSFTNMAVLDFGTGALEDDATVEVVLPVIAVDKSVDNPTPVLGEVITYTVVLSNDGAASGPAFDLTLTDAIPEGQILAGAVTLSDPTLATVLSGDGAGDSALTVMVPVLQPGESVQISYDVTVDFLSPVLTAITNTASVTGGTVPTLGDPPPEFPGPPTLGDGPGRPIVVDGSAQIFASATSSGSIDRMPSFSMIDDAEFRPVLRIDPIFTGATEYGASLNLSIFTTQGGFLFDRDVLADAAGQWIARFPLIEVGERDDDFGAFFRKSRMFDDPTGLVEPDDPGLLGLGFEERMVRIGTFLGDEAFVLQVEDDASASGPQSEATFNTRVSYVPAVIGPGFVTDTVLDVSEVFEDIADVTVERLFDAARTPLEAGLNRFNAEFLSSAATISGRP
ncbi:MAG: isopeptide-forming domain-containing fimbrial protein [Pseudomonadota bacterium]